MKQEFTSMNNKMFFMIYGALMASLGVYAYLIFAGLLQTGTKTPLAEWPSSNYADIVNIPLYVVVVVTILSSMLFKRLMHPDRIKEIKAKVDPSKMRLDKWSNEQIGKFQSMPLEDQKSVAAHISLFSSGIMVLAMNEFVGVMGVMGVVLGVPLQSCYSFIGASFMLSTYMFFRIKSQMEQV
jgi:hypothetical protein